MEGSYPVPPVISLNVFCALDPEKVVACVWPKTHVLTASREANGQERGLVAGDVRTVWNTKISGPPLACHSAVFEQGVSWTKPAGWQEWPRFRSRWEGPCVSGWNGSGPSVVNSQSITQTLLCNLICASAISGRLSATSGGVTGVVVPTFPGCTFPPTIPNGQRTTGQDTGP